MGPCIRAFVWPSTRTLGLARSLARGTKRHPDWPPQLVKVSAAENSSASSTGLSVCCPREPSTAMETFYMYLHRSVW